MKKYPAILILFFYLQTQMYADSDVRYSFEVFTGYSTGHTTYVLDINDLVKSELIFPLDAFLLGGEASVYLPSAGNYHEWRIRAAASANLTDPDNLMVDTDWDQRFTGYPGVIFSYTESPVELSMIKLNFQAEKLLFSGDFITGYFLAGYEYQNIQQDITGYTGWQYAEDGSGLLKLFLADSSEPALFYEITYHKPGAGISLQFEPHENIDLAFSAMARAVYVKDYDDHLLRYKLSTAEGWGTGGAVMFDFAYRLYGEEKIIPFLGITAGAEYIKADILQKQEWYDDEKYSDGTIAVNKGTVYTNIPHLVTSFQGYVILKAGILF